MLDIDTRRRAACDLVRALCRHFEAPVIEIFSSYVTSLLTVSVVCVCLSVCLFVCVSVCQYIYFFINELQHQSNS